MGGENSRKQNLIPILPTGEYMTLFHVKKTDGTNNKGIKNNLNNKESEWNITNHVEHWTRFDRRRHISLFFSGNSLFYININPSSKFSVFPVSRLKLHIPMIRFSLLRTPIYNPTAKSNLRSQTGGSYDHCPTVVHTTTGAPVLWYPGSHSNLITVPYRFPSPFRIVRTACGVSGSAGQDEARQTGSFSQRPFSWQRTVSVGLPPGNPKPA